MSNVDKEQMVEESSTLPRVSELPEKEGMKVDEVEARTNFEDINVDQTVTEISEVVKPIGIPFPEIDPVLFEIGPLAIRWYSLAYLFGIILGWLYIQYLNKKHNNGYIKSEQMDAMPLWIVLSIILGGRLGYVLFYNLPYYMDNLSEVVKVWNGGMSFHGGLLGVIIGMYLFSRTYSLRYFKLMDMLAAATPIGLFLGRIANFINMELWGKRTAWEYGIVYPNENFARHPSQLYEAAMEGLLLFIILYITVRLGGLKRVGLCSGLFLLFYGAFRLVAEFYREPDAHLGFLYNTDWLTTGMVLCFPMILIGLILALRSQKEK